MGFQRKFISLFRGFCSCFKEFYRFAQGILYVCSRLGLFKGI